MLPTDPRSQLEIISSSFTRPDNATQYAAGEVVAPTGSPPAAKVLTPAQYENGGRGIIVNATLVDSANQATKLQGEIWLFTQELAVRDADNALFTPTDADLLNLIGILTLPVAIVGDATVGAGGNCVFFIDEVSAISKSIDTSRAIYWELVTRNAYTPVALEVFTLLLGVMQTSWYMGR